MLYIIGVLQSKKNSAVFLCFCQMKIKFHMETDCGISLEHHFIFTLFYSSI